MVNSENLPAVNETVNWEKYLICSICLFAALLCLIFSMLLPSVKKYQAMNHMVNGNYLQAYNIYKELDGTGNTEDQFEMACQFLYHNAAELFANGEYEKALEYFLALGKYSDAPQRIEQVSLLLDDEVLLEFMKELSQTSKKVDDSALHTIARAYLEGEWITCSGFRICDRLFDSIERAGEKIYISKDMEIRSVRIPVNSLQPSASGTKLSASDYDVDSFSIDLISGEIYVCYQNGSSFEGHEGNFRGSLKKTQ